MTTPKPPSQPGCVWVEKCIEVCTARSVYVEDRGVRATFFNPRHLQVRKIHYDGCYVARDEEVKQADYIVGLPGSIDVIVELKGSDTNIKYAAQQIENTLQAWRQDQNAAVVVAALIVYGRIEGKKKLPGRHPRAEAVISGLIADFLKNPKIKILLVIKENGKRQFRFNDFRRKSDVH
jgi:hypothetical protein